MPRDVNYKLFYWCSFSEVQQLYLRPLFGKQNSAEAVKTSDEDEITIEKFLQAQKSKKT